MSKQHTPWKGIKTHPKLDTIIIDSNGWDICHVENAEAAKFIVKACNNHDKLVEALDTLVNTANDGVYGDHYSAWVVAKQLLTELKS